MHYVQLERFGLLSRACAPDAANAGSAAAQGRSQHVSRRISELEKDLAVRLFERKPDGFVLTEDGHRCGDC